MTKAAGARIYCRHYVRAGEEKATVNGCGNVWRTWVIYMQRKWCRSSFARRTAEGGCPHRFCIVFRSTFLDGDGGLVFLVGAFEVGEFVIGFEVPDAGGDFVDQVVIVGY